MSRKKFLSIFLFVIVGKCYSVSNSYEVKGKGQMLASEKGKFSIRIDAPETFSVNSFVLKISKMKPEPKTIVYHEATGGGILWPLGLFIPWESQDAPIVSGKELQFISDIETNKEYEFELTEGSYYASIDSLRNAELDLNSVESKEFFITFGFSHNFPLSSSAEINEYIKDKCEVFNREDNRYNRRKYRYTIISHCPKIEIKKGMKTKFILSGDESVIDKESIFLKTLLSMFLAPITNYAGYYKYRNYTAKIIEQSF